MKIKRKKRGGRGKISPHFFPTTSPINCIGAAISKLGGAYQDEGEGRKRKHMEMVDPISLSLSLSFPDRTFDQFFRKKHDFIYVLYYLCMFHLCFLLCMFLSMFSMMHVFNYVFYYACFYLCFLLLMRVFICVLCYLCMFLSVFCITYACFYMLCSTSLNQAYVKKPVVEQTLIENDIFTVQFLNIKT